MLKLFLKPISVLLLVYCVCLVQVPSTYAEPYSKWNPLRFFVEPENNNIAPTPPAEKEKKPSKEEKKAEKRREEEKKKADKAVVAVPIHQGALLQTDSGKIIIELLPEQAPITVANFTKLVQQDFYRDMKFHRVVPGFVVQTGDPTGTGYAGSRETIPLEVKNKLSHNVKGIVAMARGADPNSATSQFYITLAPQPSLDGKYAIFGKVISGWDTLEKIRKDSRLYSVSLIDTTNITPISTFHQTDGERKD